LEAGLDQEQFTGLLAQTAGETGLAETITPIPVSWM
jgi:hypothetical protein